MRNVLIVDDVYTVRMKTELIIRNTGSFSVRSVGSGAEALAAAAGNPPDVIVMDIVMVGMDGIATLQALRDRGITCPVIAYTARRERHPQEFIHLGFDGFIPKAENIQALVSLLRIILNRKTRRHITPQERSVGSA